MIKTTTIVIGGGAAGFFAAIHRAVANPTEKVLILERGKSVLEKVRISGGGRCNVTHACWVPRELTTFYPRGSKELLGPFHHFACGDTMGWFADRGVALKIEDDGRIFPVSDSSQTIIDCLMAAARQAGVRVLTGMRVTAIAEAARSAATAPPAATWVVTTRAQQFTADRLIVATGSNPAAWEMLAGLGHRITPPVPSLFAFNTRDVRLRNLAGISLPWAGLRIEGESLQAEGPLLITHKGLSGPAVLRLSAWGARQLAPRNYHFPVIVNWVGQRPEDVLDRIDHHKQAESRRNIDARSSFDLPLRLWKSLVAAAGIPAGQQWSQLSKRQRSALSEQLTAARFQITGKATNKEEFTTAGGVDLREIDFKRFQSRLHPRLYLAGEVLDIDAITGGFNFQAAWTGGYLIGQAND